MNAAQKFAWTELVVSIVALLVVVALVPWLGSDATAGFSLLAFGALGGLFFWNRGKRVLIDERDRAIESRARYVGVAIGWMTLVCILIATEMWAGYTRVHTVSASLLNWLIWIQFAVVCVAHAVTALVLYRRQEHAT